MRRFEVTRGLFGAEITAHVLPLGQGLHVSVFGGTRPHIGAVSVASPAGPVETAQFPGHKDGVVSGRWAKALWEAGYRPCVVEAGIHYDGLNRQDIDQVVALTEEMLNAVMNELPGGS